MSDYKCVNYGKATIPWSQDKMKWRLPNGEFTRDRNLALNHAKRMDRIITGKAKNSGGV